ncbi:MAG: ParB/Srx family N-terminal domain-containing protein, partial [Candidatus Neomarinimicrobiota bacterium]
AEEATGGGKEQAAGVLEGEKEPWEMTKDEFVDSHDFYKNTIRARYFDEKGMRLPGSSRTTHWEGKLPPVGTWRWDRGEIQNEDFGIAQLREIDPNDPRLQLTEVDKEGRLDPGKRADVQQYADWYKEGKRPYPIEVVESLDGRLIVTDGHRRVLAAREAGVPILAWVEPPNKNDMPMRRRDAVEQALAEGKPVPPEVLKDYPELTQKPHDNIPDVSVQKKVTVDQKAPEIEPQPPATESATPHGWVEIKGKQRPFTTYREIKRGKNKGMYRVSVGGKGYLVDKGKVRKWPGTEEVKTEERPARTDQIGDQYKAQQKAVQEPIKETDTFTDGMLPMQAKRVNDALDRSIRHNGKLTTRRAMVKALVDDGATIVEKNGERRLQRPNGNFLIEKDISKTAMDYADHLIKQKSRKQAIDKEVADLNIQVDAQKDLTRESLKKDHPDWSAQRVEDELAKTIRAGEEAGVSEANERIGKPAVKRSMFEKKAVGAETAPSTAKHEPVSQKPKPVTKSRQKKTPDLTATFPSSYSKTPREVLGKNSLWKVVSKDGKVVETEYASHPHILIVMDKKDRDAIGYQEKTPQGRDAVVSKEVVDSLLKSYKKRGTEVKTIEIAKYAERNDLGILSDGNIEVAVNPNLIGMMKRQHPNATFYLNGPERPITAFDGKEWKALIMPLSGADFESARKDAETIIEVPASAKVGKASSPPRPQGATVPKKQNVITGTIREKVDEAIKKAPEIDSDDLLRLDEIRDFKPSKWESADAEKKRVAEDREFYDSLKKKYGTIEITSPTGQGWKYNIINTKHHLENFKKQIEKLEKGKEGIALFRKKAKAEKAVTEISVDSETLTKGILSRMNRTLKSMGYDVRGADDIKMLLDRRMLRNGKLWHEDWIRAYQQAIEGAELAKARKAQKSERKHIDRSRLRELGYTNDPREAGYITPIGKLIDLSGKREGGQPGTRSYDHREAGGTLGMQEFMDEGSIRMDYRAGSFDIVAMPTSAQLKIVRKIAAEKNGEITLDLWEGLGEQRESYYLEPSRVFSVQYREGTKP